MGKGRTKRIKIGDKEVEGEIMPVTESREYWNSYLLEDGTLVKIKLVTKEILRLNNEQDQQGNPIYLLESTNIMSVEEKDK